MIELAKSLTPEDLEQNAALIKALTPYEMRQLKLNDSEVMGALGKHSGYSPKQVYVCELEHDKTKTVSP